MDWIVLAVAIPLLLVLLFSGMSTAVALGTTGLVVLYFFVGPKQMLSAADVALNSTTSFILTAVPVFLFMGELLFRAQLSTRIYQGVSKWLDWLPGGLLHANIGASAIFAATSGSSVACAATLGTVALPELEKRKYDSRMSLGSLASGGTLGILIPPSIPLIIYGSLTEQSVGQLFMGGLIPGVILGALFSVYIVIRCTISKSLVPRETATSGREKFRGLIQLLPVFGLIAVVLGTIYFGIATPTESAAMGVLFTLVLAVIYRSINRKVLWESLLSTAKTTSMLLFLFITATILAHALANSGILRQISEWVGGLSLPSVYILLLIFGMYVILGMLMDGGAMMIITLPVVYPVITTLGINPIWFGIALVILIETGLLTPPVGLNLFVIQGVSRMSLGSVIAGSIPYVAIMFLMLVIIKIFPELVLWLPRTMIN